MTWIRNSFLGFLDLFYQSYNAGQYYRFKEKELEYAMKQVKDDRLGIIMKIFRFRNQNLIALV